MPTIATSAYPQEEPAVFAVAVEDRLYAYNPPADFPLSREEIEQIIASDVEPALTAGDFDGAAVALAEGLARGGGDGGGGSGLGTVAVVVDKLQAVSMAALPKVGGFGSRSGGWEVWPPGLRPLRERLNLDQATATGSGGAVDLRTLRHLPSVLSAFHGMGA